MTIVQSMAEFVAGSTFARLSGSAVAALKVRLLDSLGCAFGALGGEPIWMIGTQLDDFGGRRLCTLLGRGKSSPDRAAFYNGALIRYLDFNDSYLAKHETCHPSDNIAPVLAAAEYSDAHGRDFLTALAVAYQVQCRLSDVAPVRAKGFDHTTQGAYAVAAGVSRALGLDAARTANALAISGTAFNALRVTRTGGLSHWKGLAYPNTAFCATHAAFLAMRGITGPMEVFEGNKGFMDAIAGKFDIDWNDEDLERVTRTIVKKFDAEVHSQASIEATLDLRREHRIDPAGIARVDLDTFDVAYNIIGGGEEGGKKQVRTKEEADHSLPYILAVALLDGEVMPGQYTRQRISRDDIQTLLQKVNVRAVPEYSNRFPGEMPCRVSITMADGRRLTTERADYEGFLTKPMSWERVVEKFERLAGDGIAPARRKRIIAAVEGLDSIPIREFTRSIGPIQKRR